MLRNFVFSGNGDAKYVRAQAGRFSYAYYYFFSLGEMNSSAITER